MTHALRLSIRPSVYRGKEGFTVTGRNGHGMPLRIFVRTRETANAVKEAIRNSENVDPILMSEARK